MANLFFDFDGTIADSEPGIVNSLKYAVSELEMKELTESEYRTFIGPPIYDSVNLHYPELNDDQVQEAVQVYHERYVTVCKFDLRIFDELESTLQELKTMGNKLYTASAKPVDVLTEILEHFNLAQYFDGIYGATDEFPAKTEILKHAMEMTGSTKSDSVLIGDTMNDINGGQNNGVKTIGVTYGFGEVNGATMIVNSPSEIISAVREMF